ncbi:ComEC/Rec2 family competence protein [Candidatus Saccharibacteria bacterium]|nr:ComEC/Rec2 family competence protein [Candidatus Saccharibacteria bacterium]
MKHLLSVRTRLRGSDAVLGASVGFLAGLLLARRQIYVPFWPIMLLVVALIVSRKKLWVHILVAILFGLSLGAWRGEGYIGTLQPYQDFAAQKVSMQATATLDAVYGKNGQLSFEVTHVTFTEPEEIQVPGTIKVSGYGEFAVYRGDVLNISGKLYPTRGGKQATMSYAQFERIGSNQTVIDDLRRKFVAGMQTALPEPLASFGLGLLIGQRNTLPYETSQALLMVGLTHIIAVSGYNLTIMLNAARRLTGEHSKRMTTAVGVGLMMFFLLFAGTSPSIVRAAVVSSLGLAAWYFGRKTRPLVLLLLAAAITTYATPIYFWSDISWWLSMLAFFGILIIAPQILARMYKKRQPPLLVQVGVETLSAELMTIPIIMFIFGQVSLVGLLANILVASVIPIAMLLSFVAGIAGMFIPLLAGWFAWPAKLVLTYMLDVANALSRIPHVFQTNVYLSSIDMVLCYGFILLLSVALYQKRKTWFEAIEAIDSQEKLK